MKYMMNAFHVTDLDGIIDAQRLQHKSNTISCFTKIRDVESIIRHGIETSGGLVLIVSGLIKLAADKDLFTYVDYAGNR
jgi:hypothetical protein